MLVGTFLWKYYGFTHCTWLTFLQKFSLKKWFEWINFPCKRVFLENSMGFSPSESGRSEKASSQFVWEPADYQLEKCFLHNREVKSNYPSGATKILTCICQHGTGPVCSLFKNAGKWTQSQSALTGLSINHFSAELLSESRRQVYYSFTETEGNRGDSVTLACFRLYEWVNPSRRPPAFSGDREKIQTELPRPLNIK